MTADTTYFPGSSSAEDFWKAGDKIRLFKYDSTSTANNVTAALDAVGAILQGKVNSELAETIRGLLGIATKADEAKRQVISLTDALSRLGGKKGLGAAAASAKIGAGPGGLSQILRIEQEQGVSFVEAARILNLAENENRRRELIVISDFQSAEGDFV
ncbi:MAG: hypothetical protein IIC04_01515, partial [Proteobacteria bacterium]|nr:hypothetical protein [Pseudomonadota bacterium]